MAYLVDAETTERHETIGDGMRIHDVDIAVENVVGGILDLQARGRVGPGVDPIAIADAFRQRYLTLWSELTRTDEFDIEERWRIEQRVRRINDFGFDVEELSVSRDGNRLLFKPAVIEEGHYTRDLRWRTGLDVQENQARRLLADIDQFGAWLETQEGHPVPRAVATARWLAEVYEPTIAAIPADLHGHLEPPELFHEFLEHRYVLAERRREDVSNEVALVDYVDNVLRTRPPERQLDLGETGAPEALDLDV